MFVARRAIVADFFFPFCFGFFSFGHSMSFLSDRDSGLLAEIAAHLGVNLAVD